MSPPYYSILLGQQLEPDNYREVSQSENGCFGAPRQIQSKLSAFQWFSTVTHHGRIALHPKLLDTPTTTCKPPSISPPPQWSSQVDLQWLGLVDLDQWSSQGCIHITFSYCTRFPAPMAFNC
ncbi:hypothetical protein MTP99_005948 [Tenebrio molitor]|nr:hypothetical protein MTP99_005948 [Tenebrio molitor]